MCGNILSGMLQAYIVTAAIADDFLSLTLNELKNCHCLSQQQLATASGLPGNAEGWAFFLH